MTLARRDWPADRSEMGALVRAHDWSATPLGAIEGWSPALRICATTALDSALPAIVLWGPELIQIYNDGYRPILGLRHPVALGQRTRDCWPEAWPFNEPIFRRVMASGERVLLQDQEYAIEPSGVTEIRYFTLSFAPARDELGAVRGVLVTVLETTRRVQVERENLAMLKSSRLEADRLRQMFAQAPGFMALLRGPDHVFDSANAAFLRLLRHREVIGKPLRQAMPEVELQGFPELLDTVYASGEPHVAPQMQVLLRDHAERPAVPHWLNLVVQPIRDADGQVSGIFVQGSDITLQHDVQQELIRVNGELTANVARLEQARRRQAFRLRLAERLRPLVRPQEVTAAACELLGQHLALSRVLLCEVDDERGTLFIRQNWASPGLASAAGQTSSLEAFGPQDLAALRSGHAVVHDEVTPDRRAGALAEACASTGIRATMAIPLVKSGRLQAVLGLQQVEPRHWSDGDLELAQNVAEWTWSAAETARAQAELRAERDRSQHTFDNMSEGFAIIDKDWRVTQMNAVGLRCGHRTAEQVIGKIHWDVWPETLGTDVERLYRRVMATGVPEVVDQQVNFSDEHSAWLQLGLQRMLDGGLAVFFRDITQDRLDAQALQVSQIRAETALRVALLGTFSWDSRTDEMACSARTREIFGFTGTEGLLGKDFFDRIVTDDVARVRAELRASVQARRQIDTRYRIRLPDGALRHVVCQGAGHRDDADGPEQYVGVFLDITERERAESALREIDRRKDQFLAMLAHELRNPLAPIAAAAQILRRPGIDQASINRLSDVILRQSGHMTGLVSDLLDVSRVNMGLVRLARDTLDLKDIVTDAMEQTRPLMEQRRHQMTLQMPAQAVRVEGDKLRLVQIFANILANAARYTPEGGEIMLKLAVADGQAVVSVRDNGVGISSDLLPQVFEIFTQAERSVDRHQGGLGLGLSLVKHLVALLGGKVSAKSDGLGKGSEFTVHLALLADTADEPSAIAAASAPARQPRRIMVVDDNVDAATALAILLQLEGHVVTVEHTAEAALDHARSNPPQVFLLDVGLPRIDGHAVARRLRAAAPTAGALLIALTGYGQPEDRENSRAAGFDHHFDKPVDVARLLAVIDASAAR